MKCLELIGSTQSASQKTGFGIRLKNCKKSAVKHSIEKPILFHEGETVIEGFESIEARLETHCCFLKTLQNLKIDT